jgi:signal peptidase II
MPDATLAPPTTAETPAWRHAPAYVRFLILAVVMLAADLWLKQWSFNDAHLLIDQNHRVLIPGVLNLQLVRNEGAVFGIGQGGQVFFVGVSFLAIGVISYLFARSRANAVAYQEGLALILSGALGNLYDRIALGHVRDMLKLFPGVSLPFGWHWPNGSDEVYPWIFNIADVALVVGVGVMIVVMWVNDRRPQTEPATAG